MSPTSLDKVQREILGSILSRFVNSIYKALVSPKWIQKTDPVVSKLEALADRLLKQVQKDVSTTMSEHTAAQSIDWDSQVLDPLIDTFEFEEDIHVCKKDAKYIFSISAAFALALELLLQTDETDNLILRCYLGRVLEESLMEPKILAAAKYVLEIECPILLEGYFESTLPRIVAIMKALLPDEGESRKAWYTMLAEERFGKIRARSSPKPGSSTPRSPTPTSSEDGSTVTSRTSETSQKSYTSSTSYTSYIPERLKSVGTSEISEIPRTSQTSQSPQVSQTPHTPHTPQASQVSDAEIPLLPHAPAGSPNDLHVKVFLKPKRTWTIEFIKCIHFYKDITVVETTDGIRIQLEKECSLTLNPFSHTIAHLASQRKLSKAFVATIVIPSYKTYLVRDVSDIQGMGRPLGATEIDAKDAKLEVASGNYTVKKESGEDCAIIKNSRG